MSTDDDKYGTGSGDEDDDDDFPDENDSGSDTAEMEALLAGTVVPDDPDPGTQVSGTVISIGEDDVFVDIAAKSEAVIARAEVTDADGNLTVAEGDTILATVISTRDGIRLSRGVGKSSMHQNEALDAAHQAGLPVEGRVDSVRKGGFEVILPGNTKAFCPLSQIDDKYVEEPDVWIGRSVEFLIIEKSQRNCVVSRRKLLEAQAAEQAEKTREILAEGVVLPGKVTSVTDFGAFIDIGGIQGLLHVSQMSYARVANPSEILNVGDNVRVQVLKIDQEAGKISLGMKQLLQDPWDTVTTRLKIGGRYQGRVTRVMDFGAFVELKPGIEGLLHVSELAPGKRGADARKYIDAAATVHVEVTNIDTERKRLSLARVEASDSAETVEVRVGAFIKGVVERVERNGVFVRLAPGRTGLVPNAEMATKPGTDHRKDFPQGAAMEVEVLEIGEDGRRIRLSRASVLHRAERASVDAYQAAVKQGSEVGGLSGFGDALKSALEKSGEEKGD